VTPTAHWQEDVADIEAKTYEFGSNHRNAIVHLINEKRVCHFYVDLARTAVPLLQMQVCVGLMWG